MPPTITKLKQESVIVQLLLLITAIALYLSTFKQGFTDAEAAQSPMFFPRIILMLWIVLNIIGLIQSVRHSNVTNPIASWWRILLVIAVTCIYVNLIGSEGFFLPSMVFALICLPLFGIRNGVLIVLFAVAVPGVLVLLFNHMLGMPLPTSRFTHYF